MRVLFCLTALLGSFNALAQSPPPSQENETVFIPIEAPRHSSIVAVNAAVHSKETCPCCSSPEAIEEELGEVGTRIAQINADPSLSSEQRTARLKPLLKDIVHLISHLSDAEVADGLILKARNALWAAVQPWRTILNARRTLGMQRSNPNFGEHIPNILIMVVATETAEQTSFVWLPALGNSILHIQNPVALVALSGVGFLLNRIDLLCAMNPFIYVAFPPLQRALTWVRKTLDATLGRAYRAVTFDRLTVLRTYTRDVLVEDLETDRFRITDLQSGAKAEVVRNGIRFYVESFEVSGATREERLSAGRYLSERLGMNASDAFRRTVEASHKPFYVGAVMSEEHRLRIEFKPDAITVSRTFAERPLRPKPCDALLIEL